VQAWSAAQLGDLDTAVPAAQEAALLTRQQGDEPLSALIRATQACIAAMRGDTDDAVAIAAEAERAARAAGAATARPVLARVQAARGLAALGAGDFEHAYRHLLRMHDPAEPCHQSSLRWYAFGDLAEAAAGCGRSGELRESAAELAELAGRTPSPALLATFRYSRAVLAADGDADAAFQTALAGTAAGLPLVRARTQLAYGRWLRRQRRAVQARSPLRAAEETFDALGAGAWGDQARLELRASGVSAARPGLEACDRLTAQELQIAQMAAAGLSNREIGQRLYLSHRTVSSHLYQIFPKLGISARAELAAIVAALG
jgi:DNA-binding CsgD family transcriptional regulator